MSVQWVDRTTGAMGLEPVGIREIFMRSVKVAAMCLAVAGLLGLGRIARAETVTAKLTGLDPFAGGDLSLNGSPISGDGVGELEWDGTGLGNSSPFDGPFTTFCIDLNEIIQFNNVYSFALNPTISTAPKATAYPGGGLTGPMGLTKAAELQELFGSHFAGLSGDPDKLQAFQLSVWNIIYDNDASVSNGDGLFYVTGGIDSTAIGDANSWLNEAITDVGNNTGPRNTQLVALMGIDQSNSSPFPQDQIVIDTNINTGVPLPSSALGGTMLLAILGLARMGRRVLKTQTI